jgi:hypothetical protein
MMSQVPKENNLEGYDIITPPVPLFMATMVLAINDNGHDDKCKEHLGMIEQVAVAANVS